MDAGVPARGLHGEAYRGHIFWDELFILPYLNFHFPEISRELLLYRYRRLDAARRLARDGGAPRRDVPVAERLGRARGEPGPAPEPALGPLDAGQHAPAAPCQPGDRLQCLALLADDRGPRLHGRVLRRDAGRDRAVLGQLRDLGRGGGALSDPRRDGPGRVPRPLSMARRARARRQRLHERHGILGAPPRGGRAGRRWRRPGARSCAWCST